MMTFFYGPPFSSLLVGFASVIAAYGFVLFKARRHARLNREQLSGQAQHQMRRGMSLFFTVLILMILFSIGGIILHQFVVVVSVLIGSAFGTFLVLISGVFQRRLL